MSECINHPGKEGIYKCTRCKKHFCLACVELIDDKAYCYDCLKEIVKEVREEARKSLTLRILAASLLAFLVAILGLYYSSALLERIPVYVYMTSRGSQETFNSSLLSEAPSLMMGLAFLILGIGLATTNRWSYWYGIVLCLVALIFGLTGAMNLGGIDYFMNNATSSLGLFYECIVIGPLLILVAVFESKRELTGW